MGMGLERCFLMARAKKASFSLMPNLLGLSWSGREGTHYMHETDTHACVVRIHTYTHMYIHTHTHTRKHTCTYAQTPPPPPPHKHTNINPPLPLTFAHTYTHVHMRADRQTDRQRKRESDTHTPPLEPWAFGSHCLSQHSTTRSRPTREVRHGSSPSSPGRRSLCSTHADGTAGIGAYVSTL